MAKKPQSEVVRFQMTKAQKLIKDGHYKEARAILEALDKRVNHQTIKQWLSKLDELDPVYDFDDLEFPEPKKKKPSKSGGCLKRLVVIILGFCGVIFLLSLLVPPSDEDAPSTEVSRSLSEEIPTVDDAPTESESFSETDTPLISETSAPTDTLTSTATNTETPLPTATATITNTSLPTNTSVPTATVIPSSTPQPIFYDSNALGLQPVIGPVDIPSGVYRVTARTDGFMIASIETLDGSCSHSMLGSMFNISSGQASAGAEVLFISEGCRALISISNTREQWVLSFEGLSAIDVQDVQPQYTSATEGLSPVLGPLAFLDGRYRVTVTTSGFFIGDIIEVDGSCDAGFMGLFNISQGQASSGAQNILRTEDCITFIQIHNAREPWTLTFELLE